MLRAVMIAHNEPEWCKRLVVGGVAATVATLPTGDCWLATDDASIIVERKTLPDFCASIPEQDGRLFNQVAEMTQASPWAYVVVTSIPQAAGGKVILNGKPSGWQWSSIEGARLTIQEMGAYTVFLPDESAYGPALLWLANRDRGPVRVTARRGIELESPAERILTSLPGIGAERASDLLQHCGSVAWSLQYLTGNDKNEIPGIGNATRASVKNALGLEKDTFLQVMIQQEDAQNE